MLPQNQPLRLTKAVARVYRELKKMDSPEFTCRLSYRIDAKPRPEFMVMYRERFAFLLAVSNASEEELENLLQGNLFSAIGSAGDALEIAERHQLEGFLRDCQETMRENGDEEGLTVGKWLLFPKVSDAMVRRLAEAGKWTDYQMRGRESCRSEVLKKSFRETAENPLAPLLQKRLVGYFSPEAQIPSQWVGAPLVVKERSHAATQTDFFLDYDQEAAMKRDLELTPEALELVDKGKLTLLTGVAGCGKSLVLLFRARTFHRLHRNSRVLILTHNRPLNFDLAARAKELDPEMQMEWRTFYSWATSLLREKKPIIKGWEKKRMIEGLIRSIYPNGDCPFTLAFVEEEFGWICDNALEGINLAWYLEVERTGRSRALQEGQRRKLFALFEAYRQQLQEEGKQDWEGLPVAFWRKIREGRITLPTYDAIYIDEAQFFAPVWFAAVKEALHRDRGQLFLVADPTQGFLRQGQSWLNVLGSEVRGRSQRLEQPYRNTRAILSAARRFFLARLPTEEEGEVNLPNEETLNRLPEGEEPRMMAMATGQDERARVLEEVSKALGEGATPGNLLIIHADPKQIPDLLAALQRRHPDEVENAADLRVRGKMRICSLTASTGLEAPVVLLLGLDRMLEEEQSLGIPEDERTTRKRVNTKKIFMAMTRAQQRLMIIYRNESTRRILCGEEC